MSSQQLIFIKRPEPSLAEVFQEMYLNERLVDVTLSCSNGQVQAHRLVLAACSPYFAKLFDKLTSPLQYPVIIIKDMLIEDLKLIVDFMYRGQLTVNTCKLPALIRSAESLQISGLSDYMDPLANTSAIQQQQGNNFKHTPKRPKKSLASLNSAIFGNQQRLQDELSSRMSPGPEKLLDQSIITGESSLDDHFASFNPSDPTSTRNSNHQQLMPVSPVSMHMGSSDADEQQQLSNQLQVLSHSLAANRSSLAQQGSHDTSDQSANYGQLQTHQQSSRGRLHPCNICWKTFREKANLKRHLQVHSLDRVVYACPDCNKTFSWKDNYIRHTKTAHHMNNARAQV